MNPTGGQAADWVLIGYSATITLSSAGHIYASVNDTFYPNDTGAFNVSVQQVPEPGSYATMLAGLGMLGFAARRRKSTTAITA